MILEILEPTSTSIEIQLPQRIGLALESVCQGRDLPLESAAELILAWGLARHVEPTTHDEKTLEDWGVPVAYSFTLNNNLHKALLSCAWIEDFTIVEMLLGWINDWYDSTKTEAELPRPNFEMLYHELRSELARLATA